MASAHQSTYQHQPLTLPKSIRVVILEPAVSLEAPVQCTLDEVDLDNLVPTSSYEALSYVWGERFGTIPILCHGRKLLVTPNCYDALIHLRLPSQHRRLFIDAICIDQRQDLQHSINERDHQIAIMGDVFERARRVMIWLGKPHPSTPKLLSAMRFICRVESIERATKIKLGITGVRAYIKWLKGFRKVDLVKLEEAFIYFIKNPWFTRIWTLQEATFATPENLVIVYGCQQIKYTTMAHATRTFDFGTSLGDAWLDEQESIEVVVGRSELASAVQDSTYINAQYLRSLLLGAPGGFLELMAILDSTNARDKVFGIYNIFARLGLNLPQPDSLKGVAGIFEATSREVIKRTASLGHLMLCSREASIIENLPSWVPDWSMKPPFFSETVAVSARQFLNFSSCRATRTTAVEINGASNSGKLIVRGTILTKIHFCTASSTIGTYEEHRNAKSYFQDFIQACRRWAQHIALSSTYPSGCPSVDAVRRTLMLQDVKIVRHLQNRDRHKFESFLECFDIMMYPNCKTYDSAVIKAKFINPVLEIRAHNGVVKIDFDIVLGQVLARWALDYNGMQTILTPKFPEKDPLQNVIWRDITAWANYAFMILDTGHFARGFHYCKEGDIVALLAGCDFPVALRPDDNGNYKFVAPLYVDGIMHGEAWPEDESKLEEITLV
ncbi:heterokaryon incompatibility protein-domain-containing protein [Xylaria scruposa]|nr:heterokaryon incompatibility protein-domain-containing protein [Xylaria scruposa]